MKKLVAFLVKTSDLSEAVSYVKTNSDNAVEWVDYCTKFYQIPCGTLISVDQLSEDFCTGALVTTDFQYIDDLNGEVNGAPKIARENFMDNDDGEYEYYNALTNAWPIKFAFAISKFYNKGYSIICYRCKV